MNSRGLSEKGHFKRNFTVSVAFLVLKKIPRDLKVVHISKQIFHFNRVRINEVPL